MPPTNPSDPSDNLKETEPAPGATSGPGSSPLVYATAKIVLVLAVSLSLYQLYTAGIAALTALVQRSIHLAAILSLTFLLKPPFKGARKDKLTVWVIVDWVLVLASIYCTYYIISNLTAIMGRESAYTGKKVTWEEMMGSDMVLGPKGELKMGPVDMEVVIPIAGSAPA